MARPWRIEYEEAYYYVLSRGNETRAIFIQHRDRKLFLDTLGETSERFDEKIGQFFGVSYSAVSHIVRDVKQRIKKAPRVRSKASRINSPFKM